MPRYLASALSERVITPGVYLTERERAVLRLVARGLGTQEISRELAMSPKTVDSHRRNIRDKLGLAKARDLVRSGVRWAADAPVEECR